MKSKNRLVEIQTVIAGDVDRMQRGGDPALHADQLAALLDEATRLTAATQSAIVLSAEEQEQASAVLPIWTAQIGKMSRDQQIQQVHTRRADGDRIALHLIGLLSSYPDVIALARRTLDDHRADMFEIRHIGAMWRSLQRQTSQQRQAAAAQRAEIETRRSAQATPATPGPDRAGFTDLYRLAGL